MYCCLKGPRLGNEVFDGSEGYELPRNLDSVGILLPFLIGELERSHGGSILVFRLLALGLT